MVICPVTDDDVDEQREGENKAHALHSDPSSVGSRWTPVSSTPTTITPPSAVNTRGLRLRYFHPPALPRETHTYICDGGSRRSLAGGERREWVDTHLKHHAKEHHQDEYGRIGTCDERRACPDVQAC